MIIISHYAYNVQFTINNRPYFVKNKPLATKIVRGFKLLLFILSLFVSSNMDFL